MSKTVTGTAKSTGQNVPRSPRSRKDDGETNDLGVPLGELVIPLGDVVPAVFIARLNRFTALVLVDGKEEEAHVADSGRLKELLYRGNTVLVRPRKDSAAYRRTSYDLALAAYHNFAEGSSGSSVLVSVDTRFPNQLFEKALCLGKIHAFAGYTEVHREVTFRPKTRAAPIVAETDPNPAHSEGVKSRLDFLLKGPGLSPALVEVKSVTLSRHGVGLFPDAPTERGVRHLHELTAAAQEGYSANLVFIAQRGDVSVVVPNKATDPAFAEALREASQKGVRLLAYRCIVSPKEIRLDPGPIPVEV